MSQMFRLLIGIVQAIFQCGIDIHKEMQWQEDRKVFLLLL